MHVGIQMVPQLPSPRLKVMLNYETMLGMPTSIFWEQGSPGEWQKVWKHLLGKLTLMYCMATRSQKP